MFLYAVVQFSRFFRDMGAGKRMAKRPGQGEKLSPVSMVNLEVSIWEDEQEGFE